MKLKKLNRIGCLLLVAIMSVLFVGKVSADTTTCEYESYYFFSEINEKSTYVTRTADNAWDRTHVTYFRIEEGYSNLEREQITLSSSNLENFYTKLLATEVSGVEKPFSTEFGDTSSKEYIENRTGNHIVKYNIHGKWFEDGKATTGSGFLSLIGVSGGASTLATNSIIPTSTTIEMGTVIGSDNVLSATIRRTISSSDLDGVGDGFAVSSGDYTATNAILTPGYYKLTYNAPCDDLAPKTYNATITYYYKQSSMPDEKVKFDNNEANPYTESGIKDGESRSITSPTKKGCTPDKSKVDFKINGSDYNGVVYYTCEDENIAAGEKLGGLQVGIVVAIAIAALGYVVYYFAFKKNNKVKNEG